MITHLLTEPDLEALRAEMLAEMLVAAGTTACPVWQAAVSMLDRHRSASFQRRAKILSPEARKTLGLRLTR